MPRGSELERLVRRLDAALNRLEATAVRRLAVALRGAERRLEGELRRLYSRALDEVAAEGVALREARARLLLREIRASLGLLDGGTVDTVLTSLVTDAYSEGLDNALGALSLYQSELVRLSAVVPVTAAARATNASARLMQHGADFATKAERLIIDGMVRGQGWSKTARELRRETRITQRAAEAIVRTESIVASDDARRATYAENGVQYVQRMAVMDNRVCRFCAERAGNVYRIEEAPAAIHPNDRCYNAPWKPEWQELGLTDDDWMREHKRETQERSDEKPSVGAAPFEKAEGREPPSAIWTP